MGLEIQNMALRRSATGLQREPGGSNHPGMAQTKGDPSSNPQFDSAKLNGNVASCMISWTFPQFDPLPLNWVECMTFTLNRRKTVSNLLMLVQII